LNRARAPTNRRKSTTSGVRQPGAAAAKAGGVNRRRLTRSNPPGDAIFSHRPARDLNRARAPTNRRIVPRTVPGSGFGIPAETVIRAVGSRPVLDFLPPDAVQRKIDSARNLSRLIFPWKQTNILFYLSGDCVVGPGTAVEASASGRAAALNIHGDLCVEEVMQTRFQDRFRRLGELQVEERPEWKVRREPRLIPPGERRETFTEGQKRYEEDCARRESGRCARCNLWL
jgi:hypothetical protein